MFTEREKEALETLVDKHSVYDVLEALTDVMGEKAEHIRANWQDIPLALEWERDARKLTRALNQLSNRPGIGRR